MLIKSNWYIANPRPTGWAAQWPFYEWFHGNRLIIPKLCSTANLQPLLPHPKVFHSVLICKRENIKINNKQINMLQSLLNSLIPFTGVKEYCWKARDGVGDGDREQVLTLWAFVLLNMVQIEASFSCFVLHPRLCGTSWVLCECLRDDFTLCILSISNGN